MAFAVSLAAGLLVWARWWSEGIFIRVAPIASDWLPTRLADTRGDLTDPLAPQAGCLRWATHDQDHASRTSRRRHRGRQEGLPAFGLAVGVILVWLVTGPIFRFS